MLYYYYYGLSLARQYGGRGSDCHCQSSVVPSWRHTRSGRGQTTWPARRVCFPFDGRCVRLSRHLVSDLPCRRRGSITAADGHCSTAGSRGLTAPEAARCLFDIYLPASTQRPCRNLSACSPVSVCRVRTRPETEVLQKYCSTYCRAERDCSKSRSNLRIRRVVPPPCHINPYTLNCVAPFPWKKFAPLPVGIPHLKHHFFRPPDPSLQTASRSSQPFFHNTLSLPSDSRRKGRPTERTRKSSGTNRQLMRCRS